MQSKDCPAAPHPGWAAHKVALATKASQCHDYSCLHCSLNFKTLLNFVYLVNGAGSFSNKLPSYVYSSYKNMVKIISYQYLPPFSKS